ncbi:MAG: hypothetical protein ACXWEW_11290, partial [Nitrososphaeraceae archaeon]
MTLLIWLFLLISTTTTTNNNNNNNNDLLDFFPNKAYGHGLSKDESLPIDISGRQIVIEGQIEPSFLNDDGNQQPTFTVRIFDKTTNDTISDINLRIIVNFKNQTIIDQQFHSLDGIVSANLIPSKDSVTHEITNKEQQQHSSKNDPVQVSLTNPVTIKSKLLSDGGLYDIAVILEKTSKGIKIDSDQKINLFISIGKTFPFVIQKSANSTSNNDNDNGNITLQVKTFYDEIQDFSFNKEDSKISFKMPFKWDLDYVNQILTLHEEIIVPKS